MKLLLTTTNAYNCRKRQPRTHQCSEACALHYQRFLRKNKTVDTSFLSVQFLVFSVQRYDVHFYTLKTIHYTLPYFHTILFYFILRRIRQNYLVVRPLSISLKINDLRAFLHPQYPCLNTYFYPVLLCKRQRKTSLFNPHFDQHTSCAHLMSSVHEGI